MKKQIFLANSSIINLVDSEDHEGSREENKMQILEVKDITWKTWIPQKYSDFPYMKCRKAIATKKVKSLQDDSNITTVILCNKCASKSIEALE
ncbi:MAG TPA: hypothetical protein VMX17_17065 [Candidatus Glassbacteria bacterium]|nr:hypothetical protein [Candidatus Glassbacteria bacterium]